MERFEAVVSHADAGLRLDVFLARSIAGLSRRTARTLIELGGVFVERRRTKTQSRAVRAGERVQVTIGGALERAALGVGAAARARDRALLPAYEVVYRDDHLVVVNKPAGLLTAPTPESDRNNLADLLVRDGAVRALVFVVHRLDLDTSGLLVFALSAAANRSLSDTMRHRAARRAYQVVVDGEVAEQRSLRTEPVRGREAATEFERLRVAGGRTLLRARLLTGRQHQIRIHCRAWGYAVAGDLAYGGAAREPAPPRQALHAYQLGFEHPLAGAPLLFERDWPDDLRAWLELCGLR